MNTRSRIVLVALLLLQLFTFSSHNEVQFIAADDKNIQYTGRIDFSDAKKPRFWAAGVYIQAKFKGTFVRF